MYLHNEYKSAMVSDWKQIRNGSGSPVLIAVKFHIVKYEIFLIQLNNNKEQQIWFLMKKDFFWAMLIL